MFNRNQSVVLRAGVVTGLLLATIAVQSNAEEISWPKFETQQLSDVYFSEGANAGDIDGDGVADVVCGPYWYKGPDFSQKRVLYEAKPQDRNRYADNFFSWIYDFDRDDHADVLVVGFPGTPAYVYKNPGAEVLNTDAPWSKHQVLDWVSNESPQFVDLTGDSTPELVCTRDGFFGYAQVNEEEPLESWTFYPISDQTAPKRFGHGLGVGDVNGDGRQDILFSGGWFEQPAQTSASGRWKLHPQKFSESYGGADMFAYDVDGDGDNDVITSHAAHDFGLGWYEQVVEDGEIAFRHHLIMGDRPSKNRFGVVISELHSVNIADIDGDGLKDIVTGKTYWSHHRQSPMWDADPVVYWFRLQRSPEGVQWVPYQAGNESGIGRQLSLHDLNGDGHLDVVVGGMKGAFVLHHRRDTMSRAAWQEQVPKPLDVDEVRSDRGESPKFDSNGFVPDAVEAETMKIVDVSRGSAAPQNMTSFKQGRWSGGKQLFWRGGEPRSRLTLEFEVAEEGEYQIGAVLTVARDYAVINLQLDGAALGSSLDLYDYPDVTTTGLLEFGTRHLEAGKHRLRLETIGANDSAIKAFMVGLDCLVLRPIRSGDGEP